eukprot:scaffold6798_cov83-Skeletonema_dohrnii-CCMP3373.AAC.1
MDVDISSASNASVASEEDGIVEDSCCLLIRIDTECTASTSTARITRDHATIGSHIPTFTTNIKQLNTE